MKSTLLILIIALIGCSPPIIEGWRRDFMENEHHRITEETIIYDYRRGGYRKSSESVSFKTYDSLGRVLSLDNRLFYVYDSLGKLSKELYCTRSCDVPGELQYFYNTLGQLITLKRYHPAWKDTVVHKKFFYDDLGLLVRETLGSDSLETTISYTYFPDSSKRSETKHEFNTNVKDWITYVDSFYYDSLKRLSRKEYRRLGIDLLKITHFEYEDNLLKSKTDTTITSVPAYKLNLSDDVSLHAYYGKEEYQYDEYKRIVQRVIYRPDYKTPTMKIEYKYKKLVSTTE